MNERTLGVGSWWSHDCVMDDRGEPIEPTGYLIVPDDLRIDRYLDGLVLR